MKQKLAFALLAVLLLSVCACNVTPLPSDGSTAEPSSPPTSASDTPTLPPTSGSYRPTEGPTQPSATGPVLPTDEEKYLARITAALTATSPERSQSAVVYAMDGGVTLRSAFTYTASENRTVYTKQRLGELTAEGGEMIVTENGSHDGRAVTPDEGITLSDLSLALSYFSAVTFDSGEETLTMNAYLSDVAVASVFGRAPTGGTGFCLHILLSGDRITELCLSYRTSNASVTVQSQYAY